MENNNTNVVDEKVEEIKDGAVDTTATTDENETVTMSKSDYEKAIQSAEDKVRGKLSKEIKTLKEEIKSLKPIEKSESEIELEKRIAALEESEKAVADRERKVAFQEKLSEKGLDKSLIDYVKEDIDVDGLSQMLDAMVKDRMKSTGYVPSNHVSDGMTADEFKKMSYSKKVEYMNAHPESYKKFMGA